MIRLYDYFRSSAAYRVRIALNLKGIAYEQVPVHLVRGGGEHRHEAYLAVNPQGRVPALEVEPGTVITQSPAILEWLEETRPEPSLLPGPALHRARIRAAAALIACDIHPLNNLMTMNQLRADFGADDAAIRHWYAAWVSEGFAALERMLPEPAGSGGGFAFGPEPTLADVCLVPQVFNARRFEVPLESYPRILRADAAATDHPAFAAAHPARQPDADPPA